MIKDKETKVGLHQEDLLTEEGNIKKVVEAEKEAVAEEVEAGIINIEVRILTKEVISINTEEG